MKLVKYEIIVEYEDGYECSYFASYDFSSIVEMWNKYKNKTKTYLIINEIYK